MEPVAAYRLFRVAVRAILAGALVFVAACEPTYESVELIRPTGALDLEIANRIVELVEEDSSIEIRIVEPPEGMSPLEALEQGIGDLTFASNSQRYRADVNTVIPLYPTVLHILTRTEEDPEDMRDVLAGKRVFAGAKGSVTRQIVRELAEELDFTNSGMTLIDDLDAEEVDVIFVYAPINRVRIRNDSRLAGFRLYSIGTPEEIGLGGAIDRATLLDPRLRAFVIPEGTYDALTPEPAVTVAVEKLLVARADLSPALVHDLFGEVLRIRPALFGERPELFKPINKDVASSNFAFSMHPGAVAYLNQDEPSFIERYSGVAEVLVTLLVGMFSGAWALIRIYKIRRKNRIDQFYVDVMAIRDAIGRESNATERREAVEKIHELQNRAFELLVGEQLAADESFRIFIELTNNSMDAIRKADFG